MLNTTHKSYNIKLATKIYFRVNIHGGFYFKVIYILINNTFYIICFGIYSENDFNYIYLYFQDYGVKYNIIMSYTAVKTHKNYISIQFSISLLFSDGNRVVESIYNIYRINYENKNSSIHLNKFSEKLIFNEFYTYIFNY